MSRVVYCEPCQAERSVLGRRCVLCGWEIAAAPASRSQQRAWYLLPLVAGWLAVALASVASRRAEGLVLAATVSLPYLLAPWVGRTMGGVVRNHGHGFMKAPTDAQASCTAWFVRAFALAGFVVAVAVALKPPA